MLAKASREALTIETVYDMFPDSPSDAEWRGSVVRRRATDARRRSCAAVERFAVIMTKRPGDCSAHRRHLHRCRPPARCRGSRRSRRRTKPRAALNGRSELVMVSGRICQTSAAECQSRAAPALPRSGRCRQARQGDEAPGNINIPLGSKFMAVPTERAAQRPQVLRRRSINDAQCRWSQRLSRKVAERWGWQHPTTDWRAAVVRRHRIGRHRHPNNLPPSRQSPHSRPASTSPVRSRSRERWPMHERWWQPPPTHPARRRCGSTIAGSPLSRWLIVWSLPAGSVGSTTCVRPIYRAGAVRTRRCCGGSRATSPAPVRTVISTLTSSTRSGS